MKMLRMSVFLFVVIFATITISFQAAHAQLPRNSHFKKVVYIIFENENYEPVVVQPDFARFAKLGALFTKMRAEVHPSQGNYIAMVAGSAYGITSDSNVDLPHRHIGDLLENAGKDWRVYAEEYPGNCFTGKRSGKYVRKHNPFMSFTNVTSNPKRCAKIESDARFFQDYANGTLPEFSMYIPNMDNDGHDTTIDFAGKWLTTRFGSILSNPAALGDVLFIVTYDESDLSSAKNEIYTVAIGAQIAAGSQNSQTLNHPALLKMIEDEFKIGNLGKDDLSAPIISGIWK